MDIMDIIRLRQQTAALPAGQAPAKHEPEMLYIGCIDARLDPIEDIGIKKGKALIFRNIGALVLQDEQNVGSKEIPQNASVGAVLEFFLNHIPLKPGLIKHIVVSGHTDCGGIKACHEALYNAQDHHLPLYLQSLKAARAKIVKEASAKGWDDAQTLRALEKEAVRQSINNLLTYPVVKQAIEKGILEVHGWVIDTATQRIAEMNLKTLEFEPMIAKRSA